TGEPGRTHETDQPKSSWKRHCVRHRSGTTRSVWRLRRTPGLLGRTSRTASHVSDASHHPPEIKAQGWFDIVPSQEGLTCLRRMSQIDYGCRDERADPGTGCR